MYYAVMNLENKILLVTKEKEKAVTERKRRYDENTVCYTARGLYHIRRLSGLKEKEIKGLSRERL